ncbi:hypothetical protein PVAP13_9NG592650 [Panicum virgatum]|uniref:Uncharacterized protein n=1 Tax=Panicum virgatum TaxID=38727 RepID=A0A8T0MWB0_PANVG|nr:hypothetical protein PVAP13_9NG592650 [Panicum virgatum]
MVSRVHTPAMACREMCGCWSMSCSTASSSSSLLATSMMKRRTQTRFWPWTYFSSQLKHWPLRRRSSSSDGERRRTVRPATVTVPGVGVAVGGAGGVADEELCDMDVMVATVCRDGLGRRPREGAGLEHPERGGGAVICSWCS